MWKAGRLYFVEYAKHSVRVLDTARREPRTIWQQPGFGPAAVALAPDGALWITGSDSNCLARIDPDGTAQTALQHDATGNPFPAPNDLVFDRHGGRHFTAFNDNTAPFAGAILEIDLHHESAVC